MTGRGTAGGGPMRPGRVGHTPTSLAAGFAITASQTAVRGPCRSRGPGLRGRAGPPREETFYRVSAGRAGSVTRRPQARPRPAVMWPPAELAAVSSLPLAGQRAAPDRRLGVAGSMASSSQPGGAEQPVLVPVLRWSSPAQVALPAVLGPLADSCPRQGQTLSLALSYCWRQSQRVGRGSRAPVSEPARSGNRSWQSPTSAAAGRRARCRRGQPGKRALLGWWSSSRYRPVATVASPCHPRQRA